MNKKEDVLNAWITIEQLSEGSIKKNDIKFKSFDETKNDYHSLFLNFILTQKKKLNISGKDFERSGMALYFDIFNFQEIVKILREKYNIPATDEEVSVNAKSEKFTFVLYFDNELEFDAKKLFFTMSGYIRYKKKLPTYKDFLQAEDRLKKDLLDKFEDKDFNTVLVDLLRQYKATLANCRYGFVRNLDNDDVNLHSFYIDDLEKAKTVRAHNLNRYFDGFSGQRKNLDGNESSNEFNPTIFQKILQPKLYPLGRFPSNPDFSLSFMQQVAVNLALNDENNIRSVNGPPGTGKTTLLKDIFADLVVEQAKEVCGLSNKEIKGEYENGKLGFLPSQISVKNIVVASSNNGAVQNIVNELPLIEDIAEEFKIEILEADYFKENSNMKLDIKWNNGKLNHTTSPMCEEKNWGVFSLEGGKKENIDKLLIRVELIENYLEENYQPNTRVYQEFLSLYNRLSSERDKFQVYSEHVQKLSNLKIQYKKQSAYFSHERNRKQNALFTFKHETASEIEDLQRGKNDFHDELDEITRKISIFSLERKQKERDFDVFKSQKPTFLWLQKIFNKPVVNQYSEKLEAANEKLNSIIKQESTLLGREASIIKQLRAQDGKIGSISKQYENAKLDFDSWVKVQFDDIQQLKQQISSLEKRLKLHDEIKALDFSKDYPDLQKSNPWFTKDFRIAQSKLFISALKVRKQFLYENKKYLKASREIWINQSDYISKEKGSQLVEESWQWLNFVIPVVSTTFASFGRMFYNLNETSISNLFIDEAGQASPQASVGAIFRSKKVMVVGDPSQIKPVLDLDSKALSLIGRNYQATEKFVSSNASTQTLVDATSQYGFQKNEEEWIGIPLWVHRRSNYPMFDISNEISYDGLMVQGKSEDEAQGKSDWFDISGKANNKFVREQAEFLKTRIAEHLQQNPELADEIYVISPFKNIAYKLANTLDSIGFTKRDEKRNPINIGTVHTFQGKEAKIVYFVLGADTASKGAAKWVVSEPNIVNVAATRAKEEFYVVGDKKLYASLSKIANTTISIIDEYNSKKSSHGHLKLMLYETTK